MSRRIGPQNPNPLPLGDLLNRVVRKLDLETRLKEHSVGPVWEKAMGAVVATHTRPVSLRHGVLLVETRTAAWMNELSLRRDDVRRAVNRELREDVVRQLRFRVGTGFVPRAPSQTPAKPPPLRVSEQEVADVEAALEMEDPELREIVARALALAKRRAQESGGS